MIYQIIVNTLVAVSFDVLSPSVSVPLHTGYLSAASLAQPPSTLRLRPAHWDTSSTKHDAKTLSDGFKRSKRSSSLQTGTSVGRTKDNRNALLGQSNKQFQSFRAYGTSGTHGSNGPSLTKTLRRLKCPTKHSETKSKNNPWLQLFHLSEFNHSWSVHRHHLIQAIGCAGIVNGPINKNIVGRIRPARYFDILLYKCLNPQLLPKLLLVQNGPSIKQPSGQGASLGEKVEP